MHICDSGNMQILMTYTLSIQQLVYYYTDICHLLISEMAVKITDLTVTIVNFM